MEWNWLVEKHNLILEAEKYRAELRTARENAAMTPVEAICKAGPGGIVEFPDDAERILRKLEAAGFDVVERPKLGKRPVAFRVLGDLHQWKYYENERDASLAADRHGTEYQGLYVRDGT